MTPREQLIMEQLPLVRQVAGALHEGAPSRFSLGDLITAGVVGLVSAVDQFEPTKGVSFRSYAEHSIRGAILDSLGGLDLPSRKQLQHADGPPSEPDAIPGASVSPKRTRVLHAEDNPVFRSVVKSLLTKWGYEPVICCDGNEAWEAMQREDSPRLLLLDWMMPGIDGLELCRRLRADPNRPYAYIIMLTARSEAQDLVEAMNGGCDDYISKPFNAHELRTRLRAGRRVLGVLEESYRAQEASRESYPSAHIYPSCFLSHSSLDSGFVQVLFSMLDTEGVSCWYAPEDLKIGEKFRQRIDEKIRSSDKLLLVLSEHSVESPWVEDEAESALERERREGRSILFPIRIDDAVLHTGKAWAAAIRRTRHIGDFSNWRFQDSYHAAFQRLLKDLSARVREGEQSGANSPHGPSGNTVSAGE